MLAKLANDKGFANQTRASNQHRLFSCASWKRCNFFSIFLAIIRKPPCPVFHDDYIIDCPIFQWVIAGFIRFFIAVIITRIKQQELPCPCCRSSLHLSHDFLAHNILYPAANHLHPPHPSMPSARFPSSSHPHLPPQPSPEQAPQPALRTPSTRIPTASIARPHKSA